MRGHPEKKDYVLGGNYESVVDNDGVYKVIMKLVVYLQKATDFGIYKCIAKNALGSSEDMIRVLRESRIFIFQLTSLIDVFEFLKHRNLLKAIGLFQLDT